MSVLVEHGGSGSKAAAPLAKKLMKVVIDRHEERKNKTKYHLNMLNNSSFSNQLTFFQKIRSIDYMLFN